MPVAHQPLPAIIGELVGMAAEASSKARRGRIASDFVISAATLQRQVPQVVRIARQVTIGVWRAGKAAHLKLTLGPKIRAINLLTTRGKKL
jgi:hypothetical protein